MADLGRAITDRIAEDYPKDSGKKTVSITDVIQRIHQDYPVNKEKSKPVDLYYVTPYLPERAMMAARNHARMDKLPVFVKAMLHDPMTSNYCKNCGGGGVIVLVLCEKGPFKNPPSTGKSITWFDGDGQNGKGWYIIEKTLSFECPECMGIVKDLNFIEKTLNFEYTKGTGSGK